MNRKPAAKPRSAASARSVNYSTSPLLATPTPPWRSKLLVAMVGLGFAVLLGRAVYVQILAAPFFLKQGEIRYGHTLELPASRGRIVDRNGLILAASIPAPSIWAIPKDLEGDAASRARLARLLDMTSAELERRLDDNPNFVWLRRQVDDSVAAQVKALGIRGIHEVREYKRKYPEGEAAAHVVGFTNVEDRGQEGVELAFQKDLAGRNGSRRVIKDRLGRVVEDIGESVAPVDGRDIGLAVDSKVQFFAYQKIRDAVAANKAKAGSVVVLDAQTGEVLALANFPSYGPSRPEEPDRRAAAQPGPDRHLRARLDDEAVHRRLGARERPGDAEHGDPDRARQDDADRLDHHRRASARQPDGHRGDPEVEQRRRGADGDELHAARDVGAVQRGRLRPEAAARLSRRRHRAAAPLQDLAADRAGDDELRLRPLGLAVPDRPCLHRVRPRRRADPGDHDPAARPGRRGSRSRACASSRPRPRRRCATCCTSRPRPAVPRPRRR